MGQIRKKVKTLEANGGVPIEMASKPFIELQIEDMLEETRIKSFKRVDNFIDELEKRLTNIKPSTSKLNFKEINSVRVPLVRRIAGLTYSKKYNFAPPEKLDVIGGYPVVAALNSGYNVDLAVKAPISFWNGKDFKNHKYHYKRAFYLGYLAKSLAKSSSSDLICKLEFRYFQGDYLKPVLLLTPRDNKLAQSVTFQLFVYPAEHPKFKLSNLHPSISNVDPNWWDCETMQYEKPSDENSEEEQTETARTSIYNSSIAMDCEMMSNLDLLLTNTSEEQSIVDAIILMKIWLKQRELKDHFAFIVTIFTAHLQTKRSIHKNMSCYQIFKIIIKTLMESKWDTDGLSFYEDSADKIESFRPYFPVIFLSPSGYMNLCYNVSLDLYRRLKHEAQISFELLDENPQDSFEHLFVQPLDFNMKFDLIIHLPNYATNIPESLENVEQKLSSGVPNTKMHSSQVLLLVERALTDRIKLAQTNLDHLLLNKKWDFRELPLDPSRNKNLTFGLLLDAEKSLRQIDKGPDAQSEEADEFRSFWEPKCELRRFGDGSITETVVWHANKFSQRRKIIQYALQHVLKKHANIKNVTIHQTQLERFINLSHVSFQIEPTVDQEGKSENKTNETKLGTGEETFLQVLDAYNGLNKTLRSIEGLKHTISTIQPLSASLRGCSTFPPLPVDLQPRNLKLKSKAGCYYFPKKFSKINRILDLTPIEILVSLDGGGSWPSEHEALQASKMDYLVNLAESLKETHNLNVKISREHLDILYSHFVFRVILKCPKELVLLHQERSNNPASFSETHMRLEITPRVNAALDNLHREKPSFALTCRLVKRWLSSQMMFGQLDDIVIDLLVANIYLHPQPYTEPSSSLCGFKRFLHLMSTHDWKMTPIIVNFDNNLKIDEIKKLKDNTISTREKYPPMIICTPYENVMSPWTKEKPTTPILDLLIRLCSKARSYLCDMTSKPITEETTEELTALFRPSFKIFNMLIKLRTECVQNFYLSIDAPSFMLEGSARKSTARRSMPIIGFNIVRRYVEELRKYYGDLALFFYDEHGQKNIGVVMKPNSEKELSGDIKTLISNFKKIGSGLVDNVVVTH